MTRSLSMFLFSAIFSCSLFAQAERHRPRPSLEDPCHGVYVGFYDGVGPIQFEFIRLNDDLISVQLRYHGVIYQGQGFCNARGESAKVSITFENAPIHEGRIQRESDLLMFRGYQASDGLRFTAQKR